MWSDFYGFLLQKTRETVCKAFHNFNPMTETYPLHEIKARLGTLLGVIMEGPSGSTAEYVAALRQLDVFKDEKYRCVLPWDLRHYLSNRSYGKALNFIDTWKLDA